MVGHEMKWVVNPIALALTNTMHGLHGTHRPTGPWGWVASLGGSQEFVLGTETAMHYGPGIEIHRGPSLEHHGELGGLRALAATGIAAVGMAGALFSGDDLKIFDTKVGFTIPVGYMFAGIAGPSLSTFLNILFTDVEITEAVANAAKEKAEEADEVLEHATVLPGMMTGLIKLTKDAITDGANRAKEAMGLVSQAAGGPGKDDRTFTYKANHTINARDITFRSSHPPAPPVGGPADPGGPTTIHLDARGGVPVAGPRGGTVRVTATNNIDVQCDGGGIYVSSGPTSDAGFVMLQQGLPSKGNWILLSDTGINMATGLQTPPTGPRIEITSGKIELAVGDAASGAGITLKHDEILLHVGIVTLAITSKGIEHRVGPAKLSVKSDSIDLKAFNLGLDFSTITTRVRLTLDEQVNGRAQRAITFANFGQ
jgi:hypothetical protein